jgi:hypothetical protein
VRPLDWDMCALEQVLSTTDDSSSSWRGLKTPQTWERETSTLGNQKEKQMGGAWRSWLPPPLGSPLVRRPPNPKEGMVPLSIVPCSRRPRPDPDPKIISSASLTSSHW